MERQWNRRRFLGKTVAAGSAAGLAWNRNAAAQSQPEVLPVRLEPGQKLRIGIIGCGNRSATHVEAVNRHAQIEIAALCDILPEKMAEKKKLIRAGNPAFFADYRKLLQRDDLHAVAIVLPNTLHREVAVASLNAGKHVLCEKPLAFDVAGCRAIIEAADRNRKVLQVGTQARHSPDYLALAKQIRDGLVGHPLSAWINTFRSDWRKLSPDPKVDAEINWRMKQKEGGAVIYDQGIHTIDVFNWFIGSEPAEITSLGGVHNQRLQKRDSWDHAGIVVRYANGAMATYGGNLYSCMGQVPDILFGDAATLEIVKKGADLEGGSRQTTLYARTYWRPFGMREDPLADRRTIALPAASEDPSFLQYGYFFESVQGHKPPFPSARDHLPAIQIVRGALMSMAEHRHIKASEVV